MTRTDSEQEITSYSAHAAARACSARSPASPSAPTPRSKRPSRQHRRRRARTPELPGRLPIGHTVAGYGVGGVLAYAPGGLYLAGPYHGAPLSTVAIDSALVGPFDLGIVVVRSAIRVDPTTTQVSIDSAGSDPIPHILGASRCTCATSASTSTAPTSPSTRPTAIRRSTLDPHRRRRRPLQLRR